jgi:tetraacyldisaccharide 4'-kinase
MPIEEPSWWYSGADARARLLTPVSRIWAAVADRRLARPPLHQSSLPVICIGNFVAGGTGKTPLSMTVAERLKTRGLSPVFLTRGYGGMRKGPAWVQPSIDTAREAGDEPMLLARVASVLISSDRAAGARLIEACGPAVDVIVMDDGLQNPSLAKDLRIAVVDGRRGVGNGEVMPAGPLRASLEMQLAQTDAIVINLPPGGGGDADPDGQVAALRRRFPGPILTARTGPHGDTEAFKLRPVLAFSGIANPQRFYGLLTSLGANLVETRSFPDHHPFTPAEAAELLSSAAMRGAELVTTEKDAVRLIGGTGALAELYARAMTLPIRLTFDESDEKQLEALLEGVAAKRHRSLNAAGGEP